MNILSYLLIYLSIFAKTPKSTDIGQLSFFDQSCGKCWEEVTENLGGRVLVATGKYESVALDGRSENFTYILDATGGEISHAVTKDEMPKHQHPLRVNTNNGNGGSRTPYSSENGHTYNNTDDILSVGNDKAHNNRQPFIAKRLCKKVCEVEYASQDAFNTLKKELEHFKVFLNLTTIDPIDEDGNKAPIVEESIDTIYATIGKDFTWSIPNTAFFDEDGDELKITATLSNGQPLPDFIEFVSNTGKFLGLPKEEDIGDYRIEVVANDGRGGEVSDTFLLLVGPAISTTWIETSQTNLKAIGFSYGMIGGGVVFLICCGGIIILAMIKSNRAFCMKLAETCTNADSDDDLDFNFNFDLESQQHNSGGYTKGQQNDDDEQK
ncbi:MAG: putative Ig domain-containing protein [Bacteroidota bacterium]